MPLRVVAAPNALKGSLDARSAARCIAAGVRRAAPDAVVTELPVADGGDGTREVLARALGGTAHEVESEDALGRPLRASFSQLPDGSAVIDVASATGLALLAAEERDALAASSFGTGRLVRAALDAGCRRVVLGVGGSASVDGGAGLLEALGVRVVDREGRTIARGGRGLAGAASLDRTQAHPALASAELTVACDVTSTLAESARLYGPQKGATPAQVVELERGLEHFAAVLRRDSGVAVWDLPRGGAAGGIAASLHAAFGAELVSGVDLVLDMLSFERELRGADLVITAEGSFDRTSACRKGPWGVAERASGHGVPSVLLAGSVARETQTSGVLPFAAVFPIVSGPVDLATALRSAGDDLAAAAEQVARLFLAARRR